jgi:Flp pilus assembly protein TadB
MSDDTPNGEIRKVWQNQPREDSMVALTNIQTMADKFRRKILWRNGIEYVASILVIAIFGFYALRFDGLLFRIGCGLVIAATVFIVYYLRTHGSPTLPKNQVTLSEHVEFFKKELAKQRDLIRNVLWWYLAPFIPGLIFFLAGIVENGLIEKGPPLPVRIAVVTAVFAAVWLLNQWRARKLQQQIDTLDQMLT